MVHLDQHRGNRGVLGSIVSLDVQRWIGSDPSSGRLGRLGRITEGGLFTGPQNIANLIVKYDIYIYSPGEQTQYTVWKWYKIRYICHF